MPISQTTTITDTAHHVTYVDGLGQTQTMDRSIEARIFAPDTPGTYQVIIYSHGLGGSPFANAGRVASSLAAQGFIVIAPTHLDSFRTAAAVQDDFANASAATALHRVADAQFLLTNADQLVSGLAGYNINAFRPTIAGHSMGAFTASLLTGVQSNLTEIAGLGANNPYGLTNVADARFTQAIQLSPQGVGSTATSTFGLDAASWNNQRVPTLTITGTLDNGLDNQTYLTRLQGFDTGPANDRHAIVLQGADHGQIGGDPSSPAFNAEITAASALFLQSYAQGNATALASLNNVSAYTQAHPILAAAFVRNDGITAGALNGNPDANTLVGLSTDDVLFGGAGADALSGQAGNDRIIFDTADLPSNISGGTGFDTLVIRSATIPIDFNLLSHGFEQASAEMLDINSQPWHQTTNDYDAAWTLISETIVNDDGTSKTTNYDAYQRTTEHTAYTKNYDASGKLTSISYVYDDDSTAVMQRACNNHLIDL